MTKEEILKNHYEKYFAAPKYEVRVNRKMDEEWIFPAMDLYAKEISIGFMKWYGVKMIGFIIYLKEVKPNVTSSEIEEKMKEFEGKTYEELFNIYLKEK